MLLRLLLCSLAVLGTAVVASPEQQQEQVPICSWFSYDPKLPTSPGYCTLSDSFLLGRAFPEPSNFISKQLTRIQARQHLCSTNGKTSRAACDAYEAKAKLGCAWSDSASDCQAKEMTQWKWFSRHAYFAETPLSLLCPNSRAAEYKACFAIPKTAGCGVIKGCSASGGQDGGCQAWWWSGMQKSEQASFESALAAGSRDALGSCEAACYLEGVYSRQTGVYGGGDWARTVDALAATCSSSKDRSACLVGVKAGNEVVQRRVDIYKNYIVSPAVFAGCS